MKEAIDHERLTSHTSRKFSRISRPCGVWATSGWNWTA